jgi:hypothetical protein
MEKNKTGKYFKYAIGEIVLVVIGILIALSINNWNEQNKVKKEIDILSKSMISDLKSDISEFNYNLKRNDSIINDLAIVNDIILHGDSSNIKGPILNLMKFYDFRPNNTTYKSMVSNNFLSKYDNSKEKHVVNYYEKNYQRLNVFIKYQIDNTAKLTDVLVEEFPSFILSDEAFNSKSINKLNTDRMINLLLMNGIARKRLQNVLLETTEKAQKLVVILESN